MPLIRQPGPAGPERRTEAPAKPAAAPDPRRGLIALQQTAGNQAVQVLARQLPQVAIDAVERAQKPPDLSPRNVADEHPEWGEGGTPPPGPAKPEHASRADATSYESQPAALKEVLERSWGESAGSQFRALSDEHRAFLVAWYNRLVDYGLWGHVRRVKRIDAGEDPVSLGPIDLHVYGLAASVVFEVYDNRSLRQSMLGSELFGRDVGASGLLHPGQTSMREWARKTTDGIHISIGGGTDADAHFDRRSPTVKPEHGESRMDWMRSWEHHWQEVWPEYERKVPGWIVNIPRYVYEWLIDKTEHLGLGKEFRAALKSIPKPFFDAVSKVVDIAAAGTTVQRGEDIEDAATRPRGSWIVILKEYRFGSKGRPAGRAITAPAGQKSLTPAVAQAVRDAVERVDPGVVRPPRVAGDPDDFASAVEVGEALARLILHRASGGSSGTMVGIDLGAHWEEMTRKQSERAKEAPLYEQLDAAQIDEVTKQLTRIGAGAREALAAAIEVKQTGLAEQIRLVRSAVTPLGGTLVTFPLFI